MPPEALIKKTNEKEFNNYVEGSGAKTKSDILKNLNILKNSKLIKINKGENSSYKVDNLSKLLEGNKFLARIQEKT